MVQKPCREQEIDQNTENKNDTANVNTIIEDPRSIKWYGSR